MRLDIVFEQKSVLYISNQERARLFFYFLCVLSGVLKRKSVFSIPAADRFPRPQDYGQKLLRQIRYCPRINQSTVENVESLYCKQPERA